MLYRYITLILVLLSFVLAACGDASRPTFNPTVDELGTMVVETLTVALSEVTITATRSPAPTETVTPTPSLTTSPTPTASPTPIENNVLGKVCYPGDEIPAMTAYFEETESEALLALPIPAGQGEYKINLAPGTYIAYAWLADFSRGGLYSRAVPCGLKVGCDDHNMLPFTVESGQVLSGIDLCDWYAGPFNVPYPPGVEPTELTGGISGNIFYDEESIPALRVVAFSLDTGYWYWVGTTEGQSFYGIVDLPPGTYRVVAYPADGQAGGYADARHNLIDVTVASGKITEGANINDWDAPPGTFPEDPTR